MARPAGTKQPETKKITATVHGELYDAIEALANQQGRTVSSLVAHAMEVFMTQIAPNAYPLSKAIRQYEPEESEDE